MSSFNRIQTLDVAKLIGLCLVCFCHIPLPEGKFHIWTYSFHMPLFFILSGMFFSVERTHFLKSAKQLLIPFLFYNLLVLVLWTLIATIQTRHLTLPAIDVVSFVKGEYFTGPSWFLLSLFSIRMFCSYVSRYTHQSVLIGLPLIFLVVFRFTEGWAGWNILSLGTVVLGLPFYILGYFTKSYIIHFITEVHWGGYIVLFLLSFLSIYNGQVGISSCTYGESIGLFLLFGVVGTGAVLGLSRYVHFPQKLLDVFMQGALFYICMHTMLFEYLLLLWNKMTGDFSGNTIIEKIIVTLLTFVISYPIIKLMLHYTPVLLGKTKKG